MTPAALNKFREQYARWARNEVTSAAFSGHVRDFLSARVVDQSVPPTILEMVTLLLRQLETAKANWEHALEGAKIIWEDESALQQNINALDDAIRSATPDKEREDLGDRADALAAVEKLFGYGEIAHDGRASATLFRFTNGRWFFFADSDKEAILSALSKDAKASGPSKDVRDAIWNEAVEACAEHHDKMALHFIEQSKILLPEEAIYEAVRLAADHQRHAAAIRLFKHSPKAGQEERTKRGRCEYPNCGGECAECQP